jgi:hypothetical protein
MSFGDPVKESVGQYTVQAFHPNGTRLQVSLLNGMPPADESAADLAVIVARNALEAAGFTIGDVFKRYQSVEFYTEGE